MMEEADAKKSNDPSSAEEALVLNEDGTATTTAAGRQQRRRRCNKLWFFIAIFVVLFLCMTALYVAQRMKNKKECLEPQKAQLSSSRPVCKTPDCLLTAADIMSSIDPHKDPCEDFYEYACNGWVKKHPAPDDGLGIDHWSLLTKEVDDFTANAIVDKEFREKYQNLSAVNKAFGFYDACMGLPDKIPRKNNPLAAIVKEYLPWPIVDPKWDETDVDISRLIGKVIRDFEANPFFRVLVQSDLKNSTANVITVQQTYKFGLFYHQLTRNFSSALRSQEVYRGLIYNVSMLIGANDSEQLKKDAWDILNIEKALAKIGKGYGQMDEARDYGIYKLTQLQEKTKDKMNWLAMLNELLKDNKHEVKQDEEVIVTDIDVVMKLVEATLGTLSKRSILNYIGWRIVEILYRYGSQELDDVGIKFRTEGWHLLAFEKKENCIFMTKENFPMSLSRIFVDKRFPKRSKALALEIANSIQDVFQETLKASEWMDDKSRKAAIEKADAITANYGYPDYIVDDKTFDEKMKYVKVSKDSFLHTMASMTKHNMRKQWMLFGKTVNRAEWTESPLLVNPFYLPLRNTVTFPAAFLQPPFYDAKYLRVVSYGGVGAIIAHELIHGFDKSGKNFDKDGNNVKWWTDLTLARYKNRTRCLVDQYNTFTYGGFPIDGERTLSENIGDNIGVREAFKAYQRWVQKYGEEPSLPGIFNNEQLFFLSYARNWCKSVSPLMYETEVFMGEHSPFPVRVNGPLQNFPEFSRVFKCPVGSVMNPAKKCSTW